MRVAIQRAFLCLALLVWASLPARADALTLAVPPIAIWSDGALSEEVALKFTVPLHVDQWRLALYRSGDTARRRVLKEFRGAPIRGVLTRSWDGQVDKGPPIRPGESVSVILSVRDAAGNIDEAQAQSTLLVRYLMKREKKRYAGVQKQRSGGLGAPGSLLAENGIPIVIGSAQVRGSGTLERIDTDDTMPKFDQHTPDGWVGGEAALALSLRNDSGEGRSLLAGIDASKPQMLYKNERLSRILAPRQDAESVAAPREPNGTELETRNIRVLYPPSGLDALTLPHADIRPGTLKLSISLGEVPFRTLIPGRHFTTRFDEGQVRFSSLASAFIATALNDAKEYGSDPELLVQYEIFAPSHDGPRQFASKSDGSEWAASNAEQASVFTRETPHGDPAPEPTPLERFLTFLGVR